MGHRPRPIRLPLASGISILLLPQGLQDSGCQQIVTSPHCSTTGAEAIGMRSIACCRSSTRELRRIAARQLRRERNGHTLQPTALVHEAYLRLVEQRNVDWQNRAHFFGVAAQVMRRILVDHARRQAARKRGDDRQRVPLEDVVDSCRERRNTRARAGSGACRAGTSSIPASRGSSSCGRSAD